MKTLASGPRRRARLRSQRQRRIAGLIVAAIVAIPFALYAWLLTSLPKTSGHIAVAGLTQSVEIIRDGRGVPHIYAAAEDDAFYALGFVHAQDRLFQMDLSRLVAQGRLSEVLGPATLDSDRFMRMLDLTGQAEATLEAMPAQWRRLLDAYAAGVNAFLDSHSGAWPPEYLVLRRTPERWQPRDSLLWAKLMNLQLSGNWRGEIARARLATRWTPEMLQQIWPNWPTDRVTTLAGLYRSLDLDTLAKALPAPIGPAQASNEWLLSGAHTASGKPLLTNDPHLALNAPGQWYLARIETPTLRLAGATAPGAPAVVLGHNGHIAWGFTTTNADTWDLFIERLDPNDANRYLTPQGSAPFETRTETIKVKGEADTVMTVRITRHGPVLSDLSAPARAATPPEHVLAIATPALQIVDRTPSALFALNRATDWSSFVAALADWHGPMQNIGFADRDGHIGFFSPALLPRRPTGDGWLPQPGWTGEHDWNGFVSFAELPQALDPPGGRFINANNRVVPEDFPVFISRDWDSPYRARRIAELLDARDVHDRESMAELLRDDVSLLVRDLLPRLRGVSATRPDSRRALALLQGWDGRMDRLRPEALIFHAWMRELTRSLLTAAPGGDPDLPLGEYPLLLEGAVSGDSPFCGGTMPDCAGMVVAALDRATDWLTSAYGPDIEKWRWGDAHYAPFRHPVFSRVPVLRDLLEMRVPTDGDFFTVNRG
ncbi:MAG TPA: penicillin acylase family protein, partial [Alphaproteobacteria bacterium]|nr:penicillin acylase family protein [Alphaproteobacteria bacterium]